MNPTCTDAINTFFVFLNLLKCDAELISQFCLTQSHLHSSRFHASTDMNVNML